MNLKTLTITLLTGLFFSGPTLAGLVPAETIEIDIYSYQPNVTVCGAGLGSNNNTNGNYLTIGGVRKIAVDDTDLTSFYDVTGPVVLHLSSTTYGALWFVDLCYDNPIPAGDVEDSIIQVQSRVKATLGNSAYFTTAQVSVSQTVQCDFDDGSSLAPEPETKISGAPIIPDLGGEVTTAIGSVGNPAFSPMDLETLNGGIIKHCRIRVKMMETASTVRETMTTPGRILVTPELTRD